MRNPNLIFNVLFTCFFSLTIINAQEINTISINNHEIESLLVKYLTYTDPNPTWQDEADEINKFIKEILLNRSSKTDDTLRTYALNMLYDNSVSVYEDAVDFKRVSKKLSMCNLTIALLSDNYRYTTFINDARRYIKNLEQDIYKEEALVDMVELLLILEDNEITLYNKELRIKSFIDSFSKIKTEIIDKSFVLEVEKMIGNC